MHLPRYSRDEVAAHRRQHQEALIQLGDLIARRVGVLNCRRVFVLLFPVDTFSTMVTQPLSRCA
jgi:hypothetical protein